MDEQEPQIDQGRMIDYILTAMDLSNAPISRAYIEQVLTLELEFLQMNGIVEGIIDDPRPEVE